MVSNNRVAWTWIFVLCGRTWIVFRRPAGTEPDIRTDTDTDTDSPTFKEWVDARLCREPNRICTASARGPVLSIMIILSSSCQKVWTTRCGYTTHIYRHPTANIGIGVKTQRHDPSEKGTALYVRVYLQRRYAMYDAVSG